MNSMKKELTSLITLIHSDYSPSKQREMTPSRSEVSNDVENRVQILEQALEKRIDAVVQELKEVSQRL